MGKIKLLPDHIIAQIAAGEVIERPAYAVKELIENSVDAKADFIQIYIEQAGLKKIMAIDNGEGMSKDDLLECYKHHTTSKLTNNLHNIKSLGFRGEALSSIAAVSNLAIKSKTKNKANGNIINLKSGKFEKIITVGMPPGTCVIIENLFQNIPARKKFLFSVKTEFRHILEIVMEAALANPQIRFQLNHNDKIIFDLPRINNISERIKTLLGSDIFQELLPLNYEDAYIKISGFISKPTIVSTNSNKQYLCINNRFIKDKQINQAVKEGYGRLVRNDSYPIFVLFIKMPYEMVDVNVHPRKEQVAILNNEQITQKITSTVTDAIQKIYNYDLFSDSNMPDYAAGILRDEILPWQLQNITRLIKSSDILQVHNLYLVTQTYNGFLFIDQHAAHERILYEKYIKSFQKQTAKIRLFSLKKPLVLNLSPIEMNVFIEAKEMFTKLGFMIEEFGKTTVRVLSVPSFFRDHNIKNLIYELINDLSQGKKKQIDKQSQVMLGYLACRGAIKAGDKLTKKQCKELLKELEKTPNNQTCPHGRPTKVEVPLRNIHREFKRT